MVPSPITSAPPGTVRWISCRASSVVAVRSGTMMGVPGTTTGARVGTGSSAGFGCAPAGVASHVTAMTIIRKRDIGPPRFHRATQRTSR